MSEWQRFVAATIINVAGVAAMTLFGAPLWAALGLGWLAFLIVFKP